VRIAGQDIFTQGTKCAGAWGYMPENNPLHREMRVYEYLRFRRD